MLRIKEGIDLKELEKFGFVYYKDIKSSYYGCCIYSNKEFTLFINNSKIISLSPNRDKTLFEIELLYDLIKADMVERI